MQIHRVFLLGCALTTALALSGRAQTDAGIPHLQKQGSATQLIVDGKPFLVLSGELSNNAATSLESMEPIWPRVVAGNLNTVLVGVSWAQFEPEDAKPLLKHCSLGHFPMGFSAHYRNPQLRASRIVVISGCSGGGKSSLLAELARLGYSGALTPESSCMGCRY
jgi:hypothetical protein